MSITRYEHFYEGTMRRYLEQVVRAFSGFQYMTGRRNGRDPELKLVPVRMASIDRMVGHIMRNLSENSLLTVPMITIAQTGLSGRRADVQHPGHVDTRQIIERAVDPVTGQYQDGRGNSYTLTRLMPRPFQMTIEVAIWTSNQDQKHQLLEQICTVVYPTFDIQNSENALDWSALTMMLMEDDVNWSSRSIPVGTDNEIDVASMSFRLPIWFNPPAQLTQQKLIEQIVTNINHAVPDGQGGLEDNGRLAQIITTPGNHHVRVDGGNITLLGSRATDTLDDGTIPSWEQLFDIYGTFRPAESRIRLRLSDNIESGPEVIGTLQMDTEPNVVLWQIDPDTLPANTLQPIDAVIDPLRTFPGKDLPNESVGARYLILHDIGPSQIWGEMTARENDIIVRTSTGWAVSFEAAINGETQRVLNMRNGKQLRWTGREWVLAIDGVYSPGYWRLQL